MKKTQNRIISPHAGLRLCLYVMLLAFASCKSCKKEVNAPPDATQTGANTAGCLIDGKAWVPRSTNGDRPITGGYYASLPFRNSVVLNFFDTRDMVQLYVKSVNKPGRYPLSFDTNADPVYTTTKNFGIYYVGGFSIDDPDYNYITTSQYVGYVDFTVADTTNKLLAGTFAFDAIDIPSKRSIRVTEGRFDINQKTLFK